MCDSNRRWYVLYTMPQHEKKISAYLGQKGVEHYLPLVRRKRRWSDRVKLVDFPLFPGYLFVRIDWGREHVLALQPPGAKEFIRHKGAPASMEDGDMENLRLLVSQAEGVQSDPDSNFPPGQPVEVRFGPLKGVRGVVLRVKNRSRICIRLPLLNRMVSAEFDILDVERTV